MAKPNNNKNNKKPNDYFTNNIKQRGEGFIQTKSPQELQRDSINIIRQIARGNIDLHANAQYFLDNTLLSNMIVAVNAKRAIETIKRDGVSMLYTSQLQNPAIYDVDTTSAVLQNQILLVQAYTIATEILEALYQSQNPAWLYTLASQLSDYKYII